MFRNATFSVRPSCSLNGSLELCQTNLKFVFRFKGFYVIQLC